MFTNSDQVSYERAFEQVIGNSAAVVSVLEQIKRVAPTDANVLIEGETGTGKELIARAVHNLSSRRGHSFVRLNCAAIPLDLLESELFGHEKGAFTGAISQRIGRFELADKGTLFLDEVGDIPPALQPKLLRVLQEREFERLGGTRTHRVDVRLVAATNRNLLEMMERGEFREYFRSYCRRCGSAAKTFRLWCSTLSRFLAAGWAGESNRFLKKRCPHSARTSGREISASCKT